MGSQNIVSSISKLIYVSLIKVYSLYYFLCDLVDLRIKKCDCDIDIGEHIVFRHLQ